jgi:hypothetical protein
MNIVMTEMAYPAESEDRMGSVVPGRRSNSSAGPWTGASVSR